MYLSLIEVSRISDGGKCKKKMIIQETNVVKWLAIWISILRCSIEIQSL